MAVKIGHASADENGKAYGGKDGDQTKREVRLDEWYEKGWNYVLRPKSKELAEKSAQACEAACNNNNVGYNQHRRNTLYACALEVGFDLSKIKKPCSCDCSSLMHVCAIAGGARLSYGSNGLTTTTMVKMFVASGNYEKMSATKYTTSDKYLQRGDILVKEGSHTLMILEDGDAVKKTTATSSSSNTTKDKKEYAKNKSDKYNKSYTTTSDLNLRAGAGTNKDKVTVIPKGGKVRCYGYYTNVGNTAWLYVVYGNYKGFCSSKYLKEKEK